MSEAVKMVIQPSSSNPLAKAPEAGEVKEFPKPQTPTEAPVPAEESSPEKAAAQGTTEKKTDQFSRNFSALSQKERQLRERDSRLRAVEQKLQEREAQIARFDQLRNSNPLEAIQALGLSYDELTNFALNGAKNPTTELEIKNIKEQMQNYVETQRQKEELAAKRQADFAKAQFEETVNDYKESVSAFVASKPDLYEMVTLHGEEAKDLVYETVKAHWNAHQKILSMEEATNLVEEYLTEEAKRYSSAKKFQIKPSVHKPAGQSAMERAVNTLPGPKPTLNNSMTGSSPSLLPARTEGDRIARALAALERK